MTNKRCFISIELPELVREKIKKIQDILPEFKGKKTELANLHLTLKFLGEIDDEKIEKVREKLREIRYRRFEAGIDALGVFSPKFVKIVWLHLTNCDELQRQIDNSLKDLFEKERRFMGHVTIARVKNIKDKKEFLEKIKKIKVPEMRFCVSEFKLRQSILKPEGPEYRDIETYNLS